MAGRALRCTRPPKRRSCIASVDAVDGALPSLAQFHAPALRLERAASDLFGLGSSACPIHGRGSTTGAGRSSTHLGEAEASCGRCPRRSRYHKPTVSTADGPSLHQIPVGPVHAGIIEPGHFRFTASGRNGGPARRASGLHAQGHREAAIGKSIEEAARLAARVSGDSTVAYSLVFARAVEARSEFSRRRARCGCGG